MTKSKKTVRDAAISTSNRRRKPAQRGREGSLAGFCSPEFRKATGMSLSAAGVFQRIAETLKRSAMHDDEPTFLEKIIKVGSILGGEVSARKSS